MAKKIRIDFSKVEDRSDYNSRQMPEGLYKARVVSVDVTEANDGTAMLVYGLQPTAQKYRTRLFPHFCKLQQNQYWKLRDLFIAAGETVAKKVVNIDPEAILKADIVIEVGDGVGQYSNRSEIVSVYPVSALEDVDADDDYDEDYDDDDDSDDEEYEDDEDLDEDDDDDDYEDEEEDDEEEEEPAPKRAPARKSPAKKEPAKAPAKKPAAKAAPAKRVVKRRR